MRYDLEKDKSNETQKLQYVLENIPYMPEKAIPWEHYNDKEKYNAYCDSEEYMLQRKRIRDWRDAGQEVIFEGNLAFLLSQGLKSLSLIVSMLEREDVSTERRNGLAEVASYIFARLRNLSSQERELADQLASKLEKYVDQMPDKGYFSKRYYAIQKLRIYYDHMGIKEGYPFKDGRTRQHPSFEVLANAQAIATNQFSRPDHLAITNMLQKEKQPKKRAYNNYSLRYDRNRIFCSTLALLLVLGIALFVFWLIRWRK